MADYYALLKKAVASLPEPSKDMRTAIYNHARRALNNQLDKLDGASVDDSVAGQKAAMEREALENAILQVEAEFVEAESVEAKADAKAEPKADAKSETNAETKLETKLEPKADLRRETRPPNAPPEQAPAQRAWQNPLPEKARANRLDQEWPRPATDKRPLEPKAPAQHESPLVSAQEGAPSIDTSQTQQSSLTENLAVLSEQREGQNPAMMRPKEHFFQRWRVLIISAVIVVVMAGIALLAVSLKQNAPDDEKFQALAQQQSAANDPTPQKNTSRIGSSSSAPPAAKTASTVPSSVTAPAVAPPVIAADAGTASNPAQPPLAVTYRAALLVEAPNEPSQIKVNLGSVVWRFANNQVIAEITIPDVGVGIVMALRKNTDQSLPASHILAITFTNLPGSNFEPVQQMDHPLMRKEEAPSGDALNGVPARITNNQFLFALNRTPMDVARNLDLIKSREWMDVPLQLVSGKVAKLTFEKGVGGNNALTEALKSWDKIN